MEKSNISVGTIARTIVLAVTIANYFLTAAGKNPLPFSDTQIFEYVSEGAAILATIVAWWKNNSFTKAAIKADAYKDELKSKGV